MREVLVILNPTSGRGNGARTKDALATALKRASLRFTLIETNAPGHAIELARRGFGEGYETVAAAGGDGTISEVVNGLMQSATNDGKGGRLGVLPIGSGNDFADMMGISRDLEEAAKRIARGHVRMVDVGTAAVEGKRGPVRRFFDNNMGIGLEAAVTLESYKIRRLRGSLLYLTAAIRAVFHQKSPRMKVEWTTSEGEAGKQDQRMLLVSVGNSRRTGGGFFLTPDAQLDDKFLDVAMASHLSRPRVLALLPKALVGKHTTHPAVTMLRIQTLRISVPDGAPVQMDGEVIAEHATEVTIGVLPCCLGVIV